MQPIEGAVLGKADLFVVASPGPVHADAIAPLAAADGPVLVEKPLCYDAADLDRWIAFAAGRPAGVYACHNYRFKGNVQRMLRHLAAYNPGPLDHVTLEFQSPSVANSSSAWMRDERQSRTLLMDFAIHFLDLACLFATGSGGGGGTNGSPWTIVDVRHALDGAGRTGSITGRLAGPYTVDFHMRQGFAPRRARLRYQFQNYVASLAFFPDTFVPHHADDNPWLHKAESRDSRRQTVRKVADKLTGRDSDPSHAALLAAALSAGTSPEAARAVEPLAVSSLAGFYRTLFDVADRVYGTRA